MTKHFFPIIEEFLLLFRRFNPTMTTKLPWKIRQFSTDDEWILRVEARP